MIKSTITCNVHQTWRFIPTSGPFAADQFWPRSPIPTGPWWSAPRAFKATASERGRLRVFSGSGSWKPHLWNLYSFDVVVSDLGLGDKYRISGQKVDQQNIKKMWFWLKKHGMCTSERLKLLFRSGLSLEHTTQTIQDLPYPGGEKSIHGPKTSGNQEPQPNKVILP